MLKRIVCLTKGIKNVDTYNNSGNNRSWCRGFRHLSRNVAVSFFSRIPIVSFYPNTLRAIRELKALPDIEQTTSGILHTSTLKQGDPYFRSISKIIRTIHQVDSLDEIKFKHSEEFLTGFDRITNKPIYQGGEYIIELLNNNMLQARVQNVDAQFSDVKHEIDRIARKRLAAVIFIFGIAAVLVGVLT